MKAHREIDDTARRDEVQRHAAFAEEQATLARETAERNAAVERERGLRVSLAEANRRAEHLQHELDRREAAVPRRGLRSRLRELVLSAVAGGRRG